ncbi:hypothetical protein CEQ90_04110 [Lewinellaceae bacterium SD302]|nr:hypothetical protein CEQ90_04110 [Lewinellaceae bacterium SD302]
MADFREKAAKIGDFWFCWCVGLLEALSRGVLSRIAALAFAYGVPLAASFFPIDGKNEAKKI